jgi:hypothetical protein
LVLDGIGGVRCLGEARVAIEAGKRPPRHCRQPPLPEHDKDVLPARGAKLRDIPVSGDEEAATPNDDDDDEAETGEEESEGEYYRDVHTLEWLDVFEDLAGKLFDTYDETAFPCFKKVTNKTTFAAAALALSEKTTAAALDKLLKKCGVTQRGSKHDKTMALAGWKAGL